VNNSYRSAIFDGLPKCFETWIKLKKVYAFRSYDRWISTFKTMALSVLAAIGSGSKLTNWWWELKTNLKAVYDGSKISLGTDGLSVNCEIESVT